MSSPSEKETGHPQHIDIQDDRVSPRENEEDASHGMKNSKGWDGKLRVPKSALLSNPEALSDPEYSDDDNVLPGDEIRADEDLLEGESSDSEEIMCTHSRIASIASLRLERFKCVARICLRQNNIQEIEGLAPLAATLKDLDLYDNLISHMRGLDDLKHLTSLDLSFNKIKHIKNIGHMTELKDLFLVANKISKIEGLDTFGKLTSLELGSNRIRELKNLDHLKSLEELWVAKNKITELTGLGGLPNLRLLSIQSNRIRHLSPLKEIPGLEELYISHNMLESLEGIENNRSLKVLDISNNQVSSLGGLEGLANLEELWASYNQIGDFNEVEKVLKNKEDLTTVYFEGNPLQLRGPALYRNKVRLALPQVKQIDASMF
ncbi:hypothetical protein E4U42_000518 [Claviceps africana]|uniref:Uncharacterized protein n=1 Tax=Claviceps africana TaxID=83212 RepID=A0A8K0J074_9HYPO|nr:hypothetical protein E4U42_000518 [Claviceps africana]